MKLPNKIPKHGLKRPKKEIVFSEAHSQLFPDSFTERGHRHGGGPLRTPLGHPLHLFSGFDGQRRNVDQLVVHK